MEVLCKMVLLSVQGTGECANTCERGGRKQKQFARSAGEQESLRIRLERHALPVTHSLVKDSVSVKKKARGRHAKECS